ncbi:OsmC family protein [Pirellulaceae bacterium SH449]
MNLEELRAKQLPIKESYKVSPEQALVELKATGRVVVDGQQCTLRTHAGETVAGLHVAAGGTGLDACSGEMLLEALVACAGVTFSAVATNMSLEIDSCEITAVGKMDFRGTLGVDRTAPVGLTELQLSFDVRSKAPADALAKLVQLTERYCVIYQTLKAGIGSIKEPVINLKSE